MSIEITMPRLSDTMEVGTVVKWNVKEGDTVSSGDVIADIETDKATMELQTFDDGTVAKLLVEEGKAVNVGTAIAVLAEEGEDPSEAASASGGKSVEAKPTGKKKQDGDDGQDAEDSRSDSRAAAATRDKEAEKPAKKGESEAKGDEPEKRKERPGDDHRERRSSNGRIFVSPLARKIAEDEGLDLSSIKGSGPSGRIVRKDVEQALKSGAGPRDGEAPTTPAPEPAAQRLEARTVELSNMRRTIARRLVESKKTIPHYQVTVSVRMDALLALRAQLNEQLASQKVKLSVNDFLVRACALAMHEHPFVNSRWDESGENAAIEILGDVNVAVAIAMPAEKGGGLVVATLRNADRMGLRQISAETRRLAEKARTKGLSVEEMADSTFTISNLGMYGVEHFTAIINPPNAAILAVGAAVEKPVVATDDNGAKRIEIGHEMQMTMSSDHRIVDGAMAAEYLGTVKQMLEHPATLLV